MPFDPAVRRARLPDGYGLPEDSPTLSWESVQSRFEASHHYWISTADAAGNPLSRPIDGVWLDGALYFSGHEEARWRRNLRANPRVCLTLEDAENVVIFEGAVEHFVPEGAFAIALGDAANEKYEFGGNAAELYRGGACRFRPRTGHAWTMLYKDATHFRFES